MQIGVEMTDDELFDALDLDRDGMLSRQELQLVARQFGWEWQQAPIYALLDFLTIRNPLTREAFISCMAQVSRDPDGAYGQVLGQGTLMAGSAGAHSRTARGGGDPAAQGTSVNGAGEGLVAGHPEDIPTRAIAGDYAAVLERLNISRFGVQAGETALFIIDPQRSFTEGAWMWSMGPAGLIEVTPIRHAFDNCAALLRSVYHRVEVMFTRCPFPPESYGWDERLEGIIDPGQLYFIKPGNNTLMPRSNGCREWLERMIGSGIKNLVVGGCTLNSCVRVSAIEIGNHFRDAGLEVIVDLSLCGARSSNYLDSSQFGGMSAVEFAIREMSASGVTLAERVDWL
jgi:nicotinamidase-related amidase